MKRSRHRTAVSWSGGKDSALALWKAASGGLSIDYLLNTVREDSDRVAFHGVRAELVKRQADAMDLPLLQKRVGDWDYRQKFLEGLDELKGKGITTIVFGDIDIQEHRDWCESVSLESGLEPHFPLWAADQDQLMRELVSSGFRALVVSVDCTFFDKDALGAFLDEDWLGEVLRRKSQGSGLTACGENGEYHTFVFDGPPFKRPVTFDRGEKVLRSNHWLMDLL